MFSPENKAGFFILGSIFLVTTGAEALYSDLGHVGRGNIYVSWPFVKICIILSYCGQGAWLLAHRGEHIENLILSLLFYLIIWLFMSLSYQHWRRLSPLKH